MSRLSWVSHRRGFRLTVLLLLGGLLAAGCSGSGGDDDQAGGQPAQSTQAQGGGGVATTGTVPASGPAQTTQPAAPSGMPGPVVGREEATDVQLKIDQLRRTSADTVTLDLTLTNNGEEDYFYTKLGDGAYGVVDRNSIGATYLLDEVNKKKYLVLRDQNDGCVCSDDLGSLDPGGSAKLFAKFPAPPATVNSISVVMGTFPAVDRVPITS